MLQNIMSLFVKNYQSVGTRYNQDSALGMLM